MDRGRVTIEDAVTGAHLLHLAAAGCVLNDLYREAAPPGIELAGVRVRAAGDFDADSWASTGIEYAVELDCAAPADPDPIPEIPKIRDLLRFCTERVDLVVDAEPLLRPLTRWSPSAASGE